MLLSSVVDLDLFAWLPRLGLDGGTGRAMEVITAFCPEAAVDERQKRNSSGGLVLLEEGTIALTRSVFRRHLLLLVCESPVGGGYESNTNRASA